MVHQYQLNGFNIVLDTCSGSVHAVDPVAYDAISLYETHSTQEILDQLLEQYAGQTDVTEDDLRQCLEDIERLKQAGKLFSPDHFAPHGRGAEAALRQRGEGPVPPCGPHLQPELLLLLRQSGEIPWRSCPHVL